RGFWPTGGSASARGRSDQVPDPRPLLALHADHLPPQNAHPARLRSEHPQQQAQQRGLAGAIHPHQSNDLPRPHREAHLANATSATVEVGDPVEPQHACGPPSTRRAPRTAASGLPDGSPAQRSSARLSPAITAAAATCASGSAAPRSISASASASVVLALFLSIAPCRVGVATTMLSTVRSLSTSALSISRHDSS